MFDSFAVDGVSFSVLCVSALENMVNVFIFIMTFYMSLHKKSWKARRDVHVHTFSIHFQYIKV